MDFSARATSIRLVASRAAFFPLHPSSELLPSLRAASWFGLTVILEVQFVSPETLSPE